MAPQSDQTIQNATFPNVRADINDNLEALFTQSSGASEPTTKVAFQPWVDTSTSPPTWKIRNAANSAWITVGVLDPANFQVGGVTPIANGGTGQTTVAAAIAALLPSQTGNADKALLTTALHCCGALSRRLRSPNTRLLLVQALVQPARIPGRSPAVDQLRLC